MTYDHSKDCTVCEPLDTHVNIYVVGVSKRHAAENANFYPFKHVYTTWDDAATAADRHGNGWKVWGLRAKFDMDELEFMSFQ